MDGGKTWHDVATPFDPALGMMFMSVKFANELDGLAAGLGMLDEMVGSCYTADGGSTWQTTDDYNLVSDYQDVEAVWTNTQTLIMCGGWTDLVFPKSGTGVAISQNAGRDFIYRDWGMDTLARYTWFPNVNVGFIAGGEWPEDNYTNAVGFRRASQRIVVDRSRAAALFAAPPEAGIEGYRGVIAKSIDGGATWKAVFDESSGLYFNGITCADMKSCWAVAEGVNASTGLPGAWVYHTADAGATWTVQKHVPMGSLIQVKFFPEGDEGWAVGAIYTADTFYALFLHSIDAGQTWNEVETSELEGYYANDITLLDREHAYATAFTRTGVSAVLQYVPTW
eukprot:TRINITY_DN1973_c0_g1_i1.p1 TRINITY_DN1973_c0_g1~~TRINITY_DN1973_c0_g1_i1.p1  ORF type:complete len:338 (-),score=79.29 TRINITY_DN1973_c0_g1_i1:78-1091(-)